MRQCPKSIVDDETELFLRWWQDWRALKVWPDAGGYEDQQAWVVDVIKLAEMVWLDEQRKRQDASEAEVARQLERNRGRK